MEACRVGAEAEIENGAMYDRLLKLTEDYLDVHNVLIQLQKASIENHLPAFQRCVERRGRQGQGVGQKHRHGHNARCQ